VCPCFTISISETEKSPRWQFEETLRWVLKKTAWHSAGTDTLLVASRKNLKQTGCLFRISSKWDVLRTHVVLKNQFWRTDTFPLLKHCFSHHRKNWQISECLWRWRDQRKKQPTRCVLRTRLSNQRYVYSRTSSKRFRVRT